MDDIFLNQLENEPMRGIENFRQLHPDRRERVNVEKTAVVDFLAGDPPVTEPIILRLKERIEVIVSLPVTRDLQFADRRLDGGR